MKCLYKYPQAEFPYKQLIETNRTRTRSDPEFELIDTGVFDQDRYFDVFTEYAKADPNDILIRITVVNRGPEPATLHLLADAVVPQHLVLAARISTSRTLRRSGNVDPWREEETLGSLSVHLGRRSAAAVHREPNQHARPVELGRPGALYQRRLSSLPDSRRTIGA